jgi:hypothetical protein
MPGKTARSDPQTPFGRLEWRQPAAPGSWAFNRIRKCLPFTPVQISSGESRFRALEIVPGALSGTDGSVVYPQAFG